MTASGHLWRCNCVELIFAKSVMQLLIIFRHNIWYKMTIFLFLFPNLKWLCTVIYLEEAYRQCTPLQWGLSHCATEMKKAFYCLNPSVNSILGLNQNPICGVRGRLESFHLLATILIFNITFVDHAFNFYFFFL